MKSGLTGVFAVRTERAAWESAPRGLAEAVERLLGSPVSASVTQAGGFSRGIASRVRCANGRTAFVKAVDLTDDAFAATLYEREAALAGRLPAWLPAPRFHGRVDADGWLALVFEDVGGHMPSLPWQPADLAAVTSAMTQVAESATPNPVPGLARWGDDPARSRGWQALLAGGGVPADAPPGSAQRAETLAGMEARYVNAIDGDTLLHSDLRADNILVTPDGVVLVDWAQAAAGPAWIDPMIFALGAAAQGHPDPETVLRSCPVGAAADPDAVNVVLATLAGRFVAIMGSPGPAMVREFQRREAAAVMAWLGARMGWR